MPLKWERGINPFLFTYFSKLRLGPGRAPNEIIAQATKLAQLVRNGQAVELAGKRLDEHALSEASNLLRNPAALCHELLLVHPQNQKETGTLKQTLSGLEQKAVPPGERFALDLVHPFAVYWFLPAPGPEAAPLPAWLDFGFVAPGDEADLALDIVFDS